MAFGTPITYWEIWNEPDLTPEMWVGTPEEYFRLYTTVAPLLKAWFPDLKIGGCALVLRVEPDVYQRLFVGGCAHQRPPDFFSWHWYGDSRSSCGIP